ncbi:MAG: hypothetical protein KH215_00985 [Coprobacillus sp.]|nr:hypothetical protein [Coprobacillus sp.]
MGKIVIPKHSADVEEMNAVLKIHYDANDWVQSREYVEKLKTMINPNLYPSSYPKKAQVPTYFGFLECKITSGNNITERRITNSGKKMYEAIISDDIAAKQELLMDAVERVIFGKDNGGSPSSESDIDAPDLAIKCILDTGYCTSHEYAYMIWNLHDNGKKYYRSLPEILKARSAGGIVLSSEAKNYADWKPILALIRWGFLKKADDGRQKVMIHPDVYQRYRDRLENIKIYNIDKREKIEIPEGKKIDSVDKTVFKPFAISDENAVMIKTGEVQEDIVSVEKQHIYQGDSVLLVNRTISRLLAYHSYFIDKMDKNGTKYQISLQMEEAVNRKQENALLTDLREDAKNQSESEYQGLLLDILKYSKSMQNIKNVSDKNLDIEPVNLVIRTLSELEYLCENELKYLLAETILGDLNYSDALTKIKEGRMAGTDISSNREAELNYKVIHSLVNGRLLEWAELNGKRILKIDSNLDDKYLEQFKRLMIYAVDIYKDDKKTAEESLPLSIKSVIINDAIMDKEIKEWEIDTSYNYKIAQGDYIIFVKPEFKSIANYIVYQVVPVNKLGSNLRIEIVKHNYINKEKENDILKDLKEAYYGKCE